MSIFSIVWNTPLRTEDREAKPRDYLYASELGKAPIDVFLSLKGEPATNPPNDRSKRKFEAGDIWEWIVLLVLRRSGILQETQMKNEYTIEGLLRVSGRIDFKVGGKPDFEKAKESMKELEAINFPPTFTERGYNLINSLNEKYPDGLPPIIIELKSVSAFVFEALEPRQQARKQHRLQCYHYLKANNIEKGMVVYICRDDCRLMEVPVLLSDEKTAKEYEDAVKLYSHYYLNDIQPELEKPIVWDGDVGKFSKNNGVAWSKYLTKLYGLKDQFEFDETYGGIPARWNRVIKRMKEGKALTKNNEEAIAEMEAMGYEARELVPLYFIAPSEEKEEINGNNQ